MSESNIKWTKLSKISTFNDQPEQLIKVKRDDILVIKDGDKFYAMNNRCPHIGMPLNAGGCDRVKRLFIVSFILVIFLMKMALQKNGWT